MPQLTVPRTEIPDELLRCAKVANEDGHYFWGTVMMSARMEIFRLQDELKRHQDCLVMTKPRC